MSVCNHTRDLSLVWLQTESDSTQSYQYWLPFHQVARWRKVWRDRWHKGSIPQRLVRADISSGAFRTRFHDCILDEAFAPWQVPLPALHRLADFFVISNIFVGELRACLLEETVEQLLPHLEVWFAQMKRLHTNTFSKYQTSEYPFSRALIGY